MPGLRSRLWSDPRVKPPFGSVEIDGGHPLVGGAVVSALLFNESGGPPHDLARGGRGAVLTGGTWSWGNNSGGLALQAGTTSTYLTIGTEGSQFPLPTQQATVAVIRRKTDTTARASTLFGMSGNNNRLGAHVPYADGTVYWDWDSTGANQRLTWGGYSPATGLESWVFVYGGTQTISFNGHQQASQVGGLTRTSVGDDFLLNAGNGLGVSGASDLQDYDLFLLLAVAWSPAQVLRWTAEPYAVFRAIVPRRYFATAAALNQNPTLQSILIGGRW